MIRTAIHLVVYAILGCLTSAAVAWGLALWGSRPGPGEHAPVAWKLPDATDEVVECREYPASIGVRVLQLFRGVGSVHANEIVVEHNGGIADWSHSCTRLARPPFACNPPDGQRAIYRHEFQFGWPLVCMWAGNDTVQGGCTISTVGYPHALQVWPPAPSMPGWGFANPYYGGLPPHSVPTGILRTGLATNTACYAGAWWLILLAPARVRTLLRRRRGLCVNCAYDLRATPSGAACPECGTLRSTA
jgi:hypothetical protein